MHQALKRVAIECVVVVLVHEQGNSADHASGLARELVLEHNDVQVDVARVDEDGHAGGANEANLLVEDEAEDGTNNECGNGLHDCTEGDAHEAIDLLRVVGERGRPAATGSTVYV